MQRSSLPLLSGVGFILIVCLLAGLYWVYTLKTVPLDDQLYNRPGLGFIAVSYTNQTKPETNFYRFPDLLEQKLPGTWAYRFINENSAFLLGSIPEQPNQQRLILLSREKATQKDISDLPGPILNLKTNKNGQFLLIFGQKNNGEPYACIIKTKEKEYTKCEQIFDLLKKQKNLNLSGNYATDWAMFHDTEYLILQNTNDTSNSYRVDPTTLIIEKHTLEDAKNSVYAPLLEIPAFDTFGPVTKLTNLDKKSYFFIGKKTNEFFPIAVPPSDDRILMIEGKDLFLVNPKKRQKTKLLTLAQDEYRIATFAKPN